MADLTKIDKPFGLLDKETQERLMAHGGPYERYYREGQWYTMALKTQVWYSDAVYRVKPQPEPKAPEKPEVKVGSLWKSALSNNVPFEILCIKNNHAFVHFIDGGDVVVYHFDYILQRCAPYTPPRKCEGWVNVYADGNRYRFGITNYANEQNARDEGSADELYIATVRIEYLEGQDND